MIHTAPRIIMRSRIRFTCKASQQQKDAANQNQQFTTSLQGMFKNQFGNSQAIQAQLGNQLDSLRGQYQQMANEGAAGQGYGKGEESALRTDATENASQQAAQQQQAAGQQIADRSEGGALTSGAIAQQDAQGANAAAASNANAQRGITGQNAILARQNLAQGLSGVSNVDAQTGNLAGTESAQADALAGASNTSSANSYQQVSQAYQPSNFWGNLAGGALTAGLGAIAGPAGAALGGNLAKAFNGGGSDGGQGSDSNGDPTSYAFTNGQAAF